MYQGAPMDHSRNKHDSTRHPCFNVAAKGTYGRIHLPVAPRCNIKCNFCSRKYDCVNESRPGVTSAVLSPEQALRYLDRVREREPRISVAGIAGPGDPFASGEATVATLRAICRKHPDLLLCVSSNGMGIGPYIDTLAELAVSHVTITVCAVDPKIGGRVYAWVRDGKVLYRREQAAALLQARQQEAIRRLKRAGIVVKVNCIVIPGVNDHHVIDVAAAMRDLGVDLFNCMALYPALGTPFAALPQPDVATMENLRRAAEQYLPQMRHCTRCRADAVGLLDADRTHEFRGCLNDFSAGSCAPPIDERPYVAVATQEGVLINQHLGEAHHLTIWKRQDKEFVQVERRATPPAGDGMRRWHHLALLLADCRAILVSGIGPTPSMVLTEAGIRPIEASGLIEDGLRVVYQGGSVDRLKARRAFGASASCGGGGTGCG